MRLALPIRPQLMATGRTMTSLRGGITVTTNPFMCYLRKYSGRKITSLELSAHTPLSVAFRGRLLGKIGMVGNRTLSGAKGGISISTVPCCTLNGHRSGNCII